MADNDIATLGIEVKSDGVVKASADLDDLAKSAENTDKAVEALISRFRKQGQTTQELSAALQEFSDSEQSTSVGATTLSAAIKSLTENDVAAAGSARLVRESLAQVGDAMDRVTAKAAMADSMPRFMQNLGGGMASAVNTAAGLQMKNLGAGMAGAGKSAIATAMEEEAVRAQQLQNLLKGVGAAAAVGMAQAATQMRNLGAGLAGAARSAMATAMEEEAIRGQQFENMIKGFTGAGQAAQQVGASIEKFASGFRTATPEVESMGFSLGKLRQFLLTVRSSMLAFGVALAGAVIAMRQYAEVDDQIRRASALTNVGLPVSTIRSQVESIGSTTGVSLGELAGSLQKIGSLGFQGADALVVLNEAAKLSAAGMGDAASVGGILAETLNAYRLTAGNASQVSDILAVAVKNSGVSLDTLESALSRVLPIARAMGLSLQDVFGAFATLTRLGTPAEIAGTSIRQLLVSIEKPSKQAEQALDSLSNHTLTFQKLLQDVQTNGVVHMLMMLRDALGGNNEALARIFPNVRALQGIVDLLSQHLAQLNQVFGQFQHPAGAADKAFQDTDDAARDLHKSLVNLETIMQDLGPLWAILAKGADLFTAAIEKLTSPLGRVQDAMAALSKPGSDEFFTIRAQQAQRNYDILSKINSIPLIGGALVSADRVASAKRDADASKQMQDALNIKTPPVSMEPQVSGVTDENAIAKDTVLQKVRELIASQKQLNAGLAGGADAYARARAEIKVYQIAQQAGLELNDKTKASLAGVIKEYGDLLVASGHVKTAVKDDKSFDRLFTGLQDKVAEQQALNDALLNGKGALADTRAEMQALNALEQRGITISQERRDRYLDEVQALGKLKAEFVDLQQYLKQEQGMFDLFHATQGDVGTGQQKQLDRLGSLRSSFVQNPVAFGVVPQLDPTQYLSSLAAIDQAINKITNPDKDKFILSSQQMGDAFVHSMGHVIEELTDASTRTKSLSDTFLSLSQAIEKAVVQFFVIGPLMRDTTNALNPYFPNLFPKSSTPPEGLFSGGKGFSGLASDVSGFASGAGSFLSSHASSLFSGAESLFSSLFSGFFAKGGTFDHIDGFSNQVVSSPTLFRFASGMGLMGEAGPEAIMPLTRTADGSLGVRAPSSEKRSEQAPAHRTNIVFNVSTPDAASFRQSQGQLIADANRHMRAAARRYN